MEKRPIPNWLAETENNMKRRAEAEVACWPPSSPTASPAAAPDSPYDYHGLITSDHVPGASRDVASSRKLVHHGAPTQEISVRRLPRWKGARGRTCPS
jgi:hypothetical protein